jgi:hypothetical protein
MANCWYQVTKREEDEPFLIHHYGQKALTLAEKASQLQPNASLNAFMSEVKQHLASHARESEKGSRHSFRLFTKHKRNYRQLIESDAEIIPINRFHRVG